MLCVGVRGGEEEPRIFLFQQKTGGEGWPGQNINAGRLLACRIPFDVVRKVFQRDRPNSESATRLKLSHT